MSSLIQNISGLFSFPNIWIFQKNNPAVKATSQSRFSQETVKIPITE